MMHHIKNFIKTALPYGMVMNHLERKRLIPSNWHPNFYNELGEEVLFIYLKDDVSAHYPLGFPDERRPRRILWDRSDIGLDLQMYGHISIINRQPRREFTKQFGLAIESELIRPFEYECLMKKENAVKSLDALFTCSERLLDKYENAKFVMGNGAWYGTELFGGKLSPTNFEHKCKLISIVASNKHKVPLHSFRADLARTLKTKGLADSMGRAVGTYFDKISDAFDDYMYNIAIENARTKYYFTEKILDCFASMTVPVYYGATEIGKYFNEDGIITIKEPTQECVIETIRQCSEQDYQSRLDAIKDNYDRVQHYLSTDDYIIDNYAVLFKIG